MLEIKNLIKTYRGGKVAVSGLSMEVSAGDICGFIGHNGAGKTTTLKCIAGIHGFDSGEIYVDGYSVKEQPMKVKSVISYIPDNPDLYDYLTGIQYLNFIADVFRVSGDDAGRAIKKYSEKLGLESAIGQLISSYSHGMKQKLAIISALIHSPKLIIFDEPFVGLDPEASLNLKEIMREHCKNGGAVLFSTHVLDVAEKLCNKVVIISDGRLVAGGDTAEITDGKTLEEVFMEVVRHGS